MRLCTFQSLDGPRPGVVDGDLVWPIAADGIPAVIRGAQPEREGAAIPLEALQLVAPFRPGKLIGVGLNYRDHAAETNKPLPTEPLLFAKLTSSVTGPTAPVRRPPYTQELDYEGELAVVIGTLARDVAVADALDHVFGYAAMDDLSARDRQRDEPQWVRAKGGDGFAPFGPWITTRDEVPDPQRLWIRTWVNGELRQDGTTADMVFSVAEVISYVSHSFTLEPGDVITTGTPAGVGTARTPPALLVPGDVVRVEVEGLGVLETPIVS